MWPVLKRILPMGLKVTSTFDEVQPFKRLTWNGKAIGTKAYRS